MAPWNICDTLLRLKDILQMIPPRLGITLLPHQEDGVRWMLQRDLEGGGILADDMGLGKTFQTIAMLKNTTDLKTLIVCPPVLITSWTEELTACGFVVGVLTAISTWSTGEGMPTPTIWLTTYPKVVHYRKSLPKEAFRRVILDEGHAIRNGEKTARWLACMDVAAAATSRWILSATPIQNGKRDWHHLCAWLHFPSDSSAETIMLRRTMADLRSTIAALPPLPRFIDHSLSIPAGPEGKLFRILCDNAVSVSEKASVSALLKLELFMRIQQFLIHPQIYIDAMRLKVGSGYSRPDWTSTTTKWTACMTELQTAVDEAVPTIVFCQFRQEMDLVAEAATKMGATVFSVRGGSDTGAEVAAASSATAAGKAVVVVVQIVSGGCGLNLQFCRRILFLSQHWNPALVHQAVGRAVRIGQTAVVDVHFFSIVDEVADNLDRRMAELHGDKIGAAREVCESLYEGFHAV